MTTTPRRPLVPGPGYPSQSGIAAKAVALREEKARDVFNDKPTPPDPLPPRAPLPRDAQLYWTPGPLGNLAKGISGVMSEVGTIAKSGYNKFHGYHYATLQDLLFAITPLMGKHGVCVIQNEMERTALEGGRVQVTYEFSIFHTSGETWPEKPRFTGMAIGKDSKGNWDDKVIAKCHSAARKYFLLSLFQVPSGDFEDADEGPATTSQQPKSPERARPQQQPIPDQRPRTVPGPTQTEPTSPYKIVVPKGADAEAWLEAYLKRVSEAKDADEIVKLDHYNELILQKMSVEYPALYDQIDAAIQMSLAKMAPAEAPPDAMPDPQADTQESMNWVAQKLLDMKTLPEAETFWNTIVAPQQAMFDDMDWELLMQEWRRTEARLAVPMDTPDAD